MERTLRNVLVMALGFLLLYTAYGGLKSLQVRGPGFPPRSPRPRPRRERWR